jgi:tetratricopeptide (TPR) repeat protein
MSFSFLPFLLIILSLTVIIVIIVRKFPQLSLLDVDNIPEVKEGKKKDEYLKKQAIKKSDETKKQLTEKSKPFIQRLKEIQLSFRKYVGKIEKMINEQAKKSEKPKKIMTKEERKEKRSELDILLKESANAFDTENYELAEQKYIDAIRISPNSKRAYRGLADVYYSQEQWGEAKETYKFLLKFDKKNDNVLVKLGEIAEQEGAKEEAVDYYQQALLINPNSSVRFAKVAALLQQLDQHETALSAIEEALDLEPQNPKYLDIFVESSIILGRKDLALEGFKQLRMVNPENQKLKSLKNRIYSLQDQE